MNVRRKIGKAVFGLALALPLVLGAQAQAQDNVSLRLNWYLGGLHVPFYYGVDRGFYRQEGINLTINEGRGSANTVQVVGAGTDTFGLADSSSIINLISKGGEIKSVMNILSSTGFSVVSAASAGIRTPKDIEGKTLAVSPGDPIRGLLEAVAAHNKVDISKVRFVQVDPAAKVVTVLEKRADGLLGGADDQFFLLKYRGVEPHALRFADHGANIVGMAIFTGNNTIKSNPDLVRRFIRATKRAWEEARKNPDAAVDVAMKVKPDLNRQSTKDQMLVDFELMDSVNVKGQIGFGHEKDWSQTIDLLKRYRGLETQLNWTAFHTNEFLPR
jgi:NitT/TauT family transport system substrate-binding protein